MKLISLWTLKGLLLRLHPIFTIFFCASCACKMPQWEYFEIKLATTIENTLGLNRILLMLFSCYFILLLLNPLFCNRYVSLDNQVPPGIFVPTKLWFIPMYSGSFKNASFKNVCTIFSVLLIYEKCSLFPILFWVCSRAPENRQTTLNSWRDFYCSARTPVKDIPMEMQPAA